jgi:hypothetical protein
VHSKGLLVCVKGAVVSLKVFLAMEDGKEKVDWKERSGRLNTRNQS